MELLHRLRELAVHNFGLKALAVLLAVLVHLVVQRDSVREADFDVPVVLTNQRRGEVFTGTAPERLRIRVRGRWAGVRELLGDPSLRLVVDLGAYRNGERYIFEARAIEQQLPVRHIDVVSATPTAFDVRLEKLEERMVLVEASTTGEAAPGFRAGPRSLRVDPDRVRLSGPASAVRRVASVRATPVDLAGTEVDLRVVASLLPPAEHLVRLGADQVTVSVHLDEGDVERTLPGVPVSVRGCPDGSRCIVDPADVAVRVEGLARAVATFVRQPPQFLVVAEVGGPIARSERTARLTAAVSKGLSITPHPATVKFAVLSEVQPARP